MRGQAEGVNDSVPEAADRLQRRHPREALMAARRACNVGAGPPVYRLLVLSPHLSASHPRSRLNLSALLPPALTSFRSAASRKQRSVSMRTGTLPTSPMQGRVLTHTRPDTHTSNNRERDFVRSRLGSTLSQ